MATTFVLAAEKGLIKTHCTSETGLTEFKDLSILT